MDEAGGRQVVSSFADGNGSGGGGGTGSMSFVRADVTSREDWKRLFERAAAEGEGEGGGGVVDCLVNNAGTSYRNKVRVFSLYVSFCLSLSVSLLL